MQRLALELAWQTCAGSSDLVKLGPGNIKEGWLAYVRQKTGTHAECPFAAPAPDWIEPSPYLARCIEQAPKHLTYLTTAKGAARSGKAVAG